jgi:regulatory protein
MRRITALKVQKRNPQRVNVYLDGEFAFGLARVLAAWLHIGQELSDDKIASLQTEDGREGAFQHALRFIGYRPRSEHEIRQNLSEHKITAEVIAEVIERLRQRGLVDDLTFAQKWVANRDDFRPRSRRALAIELRQKGIAAEVVAQAIAETDDGKLAYQAAVKQARKLNALDWPEFRRKLGGFLARRGFSYEVITPVTAQVWAEHAADTIAGESSYENQEESL